MTSSTELSEQEKRLSKILSNLEDRELQAYRYFVKEKQPELSPELSTELFELFVLGKGCEAIRKLRPGLGLGAIIHARIRDRWDIKLEEYQRKLIEQVPGQVQQTQLESADFLARIMAATHKLFSEKIDLYLATGNEEHLVGTPLANMNLKTYEKVLELLIRATGQDQKKTINHTGGITVTPGRQPTEAEAAAILDGIDIV